MEQDLISEDRQDRVAVLTLNRPGVMNEFKDLRIEGLRN